MPINYGVPVPGVGPVPTLFDHLQGFGGTQTAPIPVRGGLNASLPPSPTRGDLYESFNRRNANFPRSQGGSGLNLGSLIGGGGLGSLIGGTVASIGGLLFGRSAERRADRRFQRQLDNYRRPQVDQTISPLLRNEFDNFDTRTDRQFNRFRELASAQTPGLATFIGSSASKGGSGALAALQQRAAANRQQSQAYRAFGDYQIGREGQRYGLLNQISNRDLSLGQLDLQARRQNLDELRSKYQARDYDAGVGFGAGLSALGNRALQDYFGFNL